MQQDRSIFPKISLHQIIVMSLRKMRYRVERIMKEAIANCNCCKQIVDLKDHLVKKSQWRFNPAEEEAGKNGFHLDSKEPDWSKFQQFIMGEVRYNSLLKTFPEEAKELFAKTEQFAKLRYEGYKKLSEGK